MFTVIQTFKRTMSVRALSDHLQKVVEEELNEVPKRVPEDIQAIRDWLKKQPHIIARTDDQTILMFLRGCKYRLQTVKEKMEDYYAMRTVMFDRFALRDPLLPDVQAVLNSNIIIPCPINERGPQLIVTRMVRGSYGKLTVEDVLQTGLIILDILMFESDHMLMGFHCIVDLDEFEYGYLTQVTPYLVKMMIRGLQNAYPVRPKGYIVLNAPSVCVTLYDTFKPILYQKIKDRIHFFNKSDLSGMYDIVPRHLLPTEYGGTAGPIDHMRAEWKTKVESYRDWLIDDLKYRIDETKRINGHSRAREDIEGSFRKLELD